MIKRVEPRRPAKITPAGLLRIVLGSDAGERLARGAAIQDAAKPLRSAGPFIGSLLVITHSDGGTLDEHGREVIAAAALLAAPDEAVQLLVIGACNDNLAETGADRAEIVSHDGRYCPQAWADWLAERCRSLAPRHLLIPDRADDADLGRRLAVRLAWPTATQLVEVADGQARVRASGGQDALISLPRIALLARHVARSDLPFVGQGESMASVFDGNAEEAVVDLGVTPGDAASIALEEADFIVSAGNGVTDVALFGALASALGAATGASRVAVDDGRFGRDKQIGATGRTVQARAYLAIGVSGAVQHLQGIKECRHVMAVNTDAAAPIVARAEFTAVADAQALMRSLLEQVQGARP